MRFIQVGVGNFGQTWLGRIQQHRAACLVGLVDVNEHALESARDQTGLPASSCFSGYEEAVDSLPADAVLIVTPPGLHHEVALAAFHKGLHVLTEKPMADTMEHAHQMARAAQEAGRTLMVSQNYRFRPWARTVRRLLADGQFGPPDNVSVRFARAFRVEAPGRAKMIHPLVRDMSIHHFDLMRYLVGREPLRVWARTWQPSWSWYEHDPCAAAVFEFEGGTTVLYEADWVARGRETEWEGDWRVECPDAAVELRAGQVHLTPAGRPDQERQVEVADEPHWGQMAVLDEFIAAVNQGPEPETGGRDNLRSLAMSFAVMESSRTGGPVEVSALIGKG